MISKTMGRRYSKALLSLAIDRKEPLEELHRELEGFSGAITADPRIMNLLTNPNVLLSERMKMLEKLLGRFEARPLIVNMCRLLCQKGRLAFLPDIAREFQVLVDRQAGVIRASVKSARELSSQETETVRTILHKRFEKTVVLSTSVDPDLIGGLLIKVGSLSFDGSIRSQLRDIQSQLLEEVPFS